MVASRSLFFDGKGIKGQSREYRKMARALGLDFPRNGAFHFVAPVREDGMTFNEPVDPDQMPYIREGSLGVEDGPHPYYEAGKEYYRPINVRLRAAEMAAREYTMNAVKTILADAHARHPDSGLVEDDLANRTPDSGLDPAELNDQPPAAPLKWKKSKVGFPESDRPGYYSTCGRFEIMPEGAKRFYLLVNDAVARGVVCVLKGATLTACKAKATDLDRIGVARPEAVEA